jgi:hypothetical protein
MLNQTCIIPFGFSGASHFTNTVTGLTGWATTFLGGVPGAVYLCARGINLQSHCTCICVLEVSIYNHIVHVFVC